MILTLTSLLLEVLLKQHTLDQRGLTYGYEIYPINKVAINMLSGSNLSKELGSQEEPVAVKVVDNIKYRGVVGEQEHCE
jgi:hypothetical protein